ncbi:MAG: hypothetical protein A2675_02940 [Candidatus Yonathbacteria bacterium RIFCSPHIGHO2_01_FULL_51_10]|uniref:Uncharacterized protein n=1 Tax=Candidatus Yonathbacteria bacterium RIFCSPHIGHO2_01_FULL_51_10 TaxID=1802723 RepID=A0A1G2S8C7_9BACT|nr:MAG: hypothetical protein A2675_02940 [Candidatus Yonathbacteria bacterium RIFCSPHIGHO2_01_FULL_51_10]
MGIKIEFNPDLALRNYSEYEAGKRKKEECIPRDMKAGGVYSFLKLGQRNYWLEGEIPLLETKGGESLSLPLASIQILETAHFSDNGVIYTKGTYKVKELIPIDEVKFNGFAKL